MQATARGVLSASSCRRARATRARPSAAHHAHAHASEPVAPAGRCPLAPRAPPRVRRGFWHELDFSVSPAEVQRELLRDSPVASGSWLTLDATFVGDAALAREVLVSQASAFAVSSPPHFDRLLGKHSVGLLQEPRHAAVRRLMAPAFTADAVAAHLPRIQALAERYVAEWAASGSVRLHEQADVICGLRLSPVELGAAAAQFALVTGGLTAPPVDPLGLGLTAYGRALRARRALVGTLRAQIASERARAAAAAAAAVAAELDGAAAAAGPARDTPTPPPSLLARLLAARDPAAGGLSEAEVEDNLVSLLVAGHDTTASSLSTALFHLARAPAALSALRAEADAAAAAPPPPAAPRRAVAVACLREAWRLAPVVPVAGRRAAADVVLGGGAWLVAAGRNTFLALDFIGRSNRGDAAAAEAAGDGFDPARWLTPAGAEAAAATLPFGAGHRACVGEALAVAEATALLAAAARSLEWAVAPGTERWTFSPFPVVAMDARCSLRAQPRAPAGGS